MHHDEHLLPPTTPPERFESYGERIRAKSAEADRTRARWHELEEELKRLVQHCPHEHKTTQYQPAEDIVFWECVDCGARFGMNH